MVDTVLLYVTDVKDICRAERINRTFQRSAWERFRKLKLENFCQKIIGQKLWLTICGIKVFEEENDIGRVPNAIRTIWRKARNLTILTIEGPAFVPDFKTSLWMSEVLKTLQNSGVEMPRNIVHLDCTLFPFFSIHGLIKSFHNTVQEIGVASKVALCKLFTSVEIVSALCQEMIQCHNLRKVQISLGMWTHDSALTFFSNLGDESGKTPIFTAFKELKNLKELTISGGSENRFTLFEALSGLSCQTQTQPDFTLTLKLNTLFELLDILENISSIYPFITRIKFLYRILGLSKWKDLAATRFLLYLSFPNLKIFASIFSPSDLREKPQDLEELTTNFLQFSPVYSGQFRRMIQFHRGSERKYIPSLSEFDRLANMVRDKVEGVEVSISPSKIAFVKGDTEINYQFL